MRNVVWTALVGAATALSSSLAVRVVDRVWRRVAHEAPPEAPKWARLMIAWPIGRAVTHTVRRDPAGNRIR